MSSKRNHRSRSRKTFKLRMNDARKHRRLHPPRKITPFAPFL